MSLEVLLTGQLDFMKKSGFEVHAVSSSGKESANFTTERGISYHTVEMTRSISPIKDLIALYKLYVLLRRERPEIVHTHTPKAGLLGMIAAYLAGTKHRIHTVAGLPLMTCRGWRRRLLISTEKLTYRCSTQTLANSFSIADYLLKENFLKIDKLKIIGNGSSNGYDTNRFSIENLDKEVLEDIKLEIKYSTENFYFLFVGRLVNDKGVNELFDAFNQLYKLNNNIRLIILGEFEKERDAINEQRVVEIINHPGTLFMGWRTEVEYFLDIADALVHPSHREGFPNILLQAAAMNTPIVCSRIQGNIDIVSNDTATLHTVNSVSSLFDAINKVYKNYNEAFSKAIELQSFVKENFSRKYVQHAMLEFYETQLLKKNSRNTVYNSILQQDSLKQSYNTLTKLVNS